MGNNQSEQCCAIGWGGSFVIVSILKSTDFSCGTESNSQVFPSVLVVYSEGLCCSIHIPYAGHTQNGFHNSLELHTPDHVAQEINDTVDTLKGITYIPGPVHVNENNLCSLELCPEQTLSLT